jgi:acyl carrier protein
LESVRPESTFEELGIDSLDRLNILFELEGEFDLQINDEEAKKVTSIHEMIAGVEHLLAVKEAKAAGLPEPPAPTPSTPTPSPSTPSPSRTQPSQTAPGPGSSEENAKPGSSEESTEPGSLDDN